MSASLHLLSVTQHWNSSKRPWIDVQFWNAACAFQIGWFFGESLNGHPTAITVCYFQPVPYTDFKVFISWKPIHVSGQLEGLDPKTPLFDPAISKPGGSRMVDQRRSRLVQGRIHPGGCVGTISRVRNDHRTANGHKRPIYGLFEPFWGHKMGQNGWIKKGCLWIKPFQLTRYMYWFSRNENFEIRMGTGWN